VANERISLGYNNQNKGIDIPTIISTKYTESKREHKFIRTKQRTSR